MQFEDDEDFDRLRSLIYRPVPTCPDWLKKWRNEANQLLGRARQADEDWMFTGVHELADQAREMADTLERRLKAEGLWTGPQ